MTNDTEMALERLVLLMEVHGVEGIERWRSERKQASEDSAERVRANSYYFAGLMGFTQVLDRNNDVVNIYRVVDVYPLTYDDLPEFARMHGLDKDELQDVLEHRRLQVSARGKTWRSGKPGYVDRSAFLEERQKDLVEDARQRDKDVERNEAIRTIPRTLPMFPQIQNWRNS